MKEITSVLLQNMLDRLMLLEKQVESVVSQSALDIYELSERVKSLNESIQSFAGNFTRGKCMCFFRILYLQTSIIFAHTWFLFLAPVYRCVVPNDPNYPECAAKVQVRVTMKKQNYSLFLQLR